MGGCGCVWRGGGNLFSRQLIFAATYFREFSEIREIRENKLPRKKVALRYSFFFIIIKFISILRENNREDNRSIV